MILEYSIPCVAVIIMGWPNAEIGGTNEAVKHVTDELTVNQVCGLIFT